MNLDIRDINKNYKNYKALEHINLDLKPGIWGLLGPNGAGKSTLMKIIVGNLKATSGSIIYNGKNINELDRDYLDEIGYLPQYFGYDKNQTVYDLLFYIGVLKGIEKARLIVKIDELLNEFNLIEVKNKKLDNLSGGMKRRVGICQALLNNPKVLVVDEPTAGLDIEERRNFRKYLTDISRDKIVIVSTHIVSDVEFIANYLIIINKARVISGGNYRELLDGMDGRVFEVLVDEMGLVSMEKNYLITDTRSEDNKNYRVRYVADKPVETSVNVTANLNDYYLSQVEVID